MESKFLVDPPGWVTKELIREALCKYTGDENLTVSDYKITGASYKGDNYSSIVSRVTCTVTSGGSLYKKAMIIKTMPVEAVCIEFVKESKNFETEILMMKEVIPEIEKILQNVGYTAPLSPMLYYSELKPEPIIIMEDLCESGFVVKERFTGLDLNHCLLTVKSMAAFHAGSLKYVKDHPDIIKSLPHGQWGAYYRTVTEDYIVSSFNSVIKIIKDWAEEKWSQKLRQFLNKFPEIMYKVVDNVDPNALNVINHGDIWTTNIMFRNSKTIDLRFIDFQTCFYQSPTFDLAYFLMISPQEEVRFNQMEILIQTYHDCFLEVCKSLNIPITYTLSELNADLKRIVVFTFFVSFSLFPLFIAPREHALDDSNEDPSTEIHKNPKFQSSFLEMLKYFEKMGLFE